LGFVKETQDSQWQKYCKLYPNNPEQKFMERVASQLNKANPNAANKEMRTFGTLGVLRHEVRDRGTRFNLCQFKPEHDLNPDTLARYQKNRLRVVPELVYSPWVGEEHLAQTGVRAKGWRIPGEEHLAQGGVKAKAWRISGEKHLAQGGAKAKARSISGEEHLAQDGTKAKGWCISGEEHLAQGGAKAKAWRIDLVLFVNGLPVATLELKSEFKQAVQNAIKQYKTTRLPVDPVTRKPEPLLTFKRGALVHFAVSQYEVFMATRLEGEDTYFLPFNKGTKDGGCPIIY